MASNRSDCFVCTIVFPRGSLCAAVLLVRQASGPFDGKSDVSARWSNIVHVTVNFTTLRRRSRLLAKTKTGAPNGTARKGLQRHKHQTPCDALQSQHDQVPYGKTRTRAKPTVKILARRKRRSRHNGLPPRSKMLFNFVLGPPPGGPGGESGLPFS